MCIFFTKIYKGLTTMHLQCFKGFSNIWQFLKVDGGSGPAPPLSSSGPRACCVTSVDISFFHAEDKGCGLNDLWDPIQVYSVLSQWFINILESKPFSACGNHPVFFAVYHEVPSWCFYSIMMHDNHVWNDCFTVSRRTCILWVSTVWSTFIYSLMITSI